MQSVKIQNERKQTLIFLSLAKNVKAITFVTKVQFNKNSFKWVTALLIKAISMAFEDFPHFNCMVQYGSMGRLLRLDKISARLTVVKTDNEAEGVYSFIIPDTNLKTIEVLHNEIQRIKETPLSHFPFYRHLKLIQRLPLLIGMLLVKLLFLKKTRQKAFWGSFTLTSLGKNSQSLCIPISGSTFTFTLGSPQIISEENYECNLVMVFDHRVLDGLQASRFLNKIKENLVKLQDN